LKDLCGYFGVSRSGYYKSLEETCKRVRYENLVLSLVHKIRSHHSRIGGKKLYNWIKPDLQQAGIKMGRDKFFELLAKEALLIKGAGNMSLQQIHITVSGFIRTC